MIKLISVLPATSSDIKSLSVLFKMVYIDTYGLDGVSNECANFIETQCLPSKIKNDSESNQLDGVVYNTILLIRDTISTKA